jgi:hypothetical protein
LADLLPSDFIDQQLFPLRLQGALDLAALPAIQAAQPTAAKNTTAIQACESESLFVTIATVIVSAAIAQIKAIAIPHR